MEGDFSGAYWAGDDSGVFSELHFPADLPHSQLQLQHHHPAPSVFLRSHGNTMLSAFPGDANVQQQQQDSELQLLASHGLWYYPPSQDRLASQDFRDDVTFQLNPRLVTMFGNSGVQQQQPCQGQPRGQIAGKTEFVSDRLMKFFHRFF